MIPPAIRDRRQHDAFERVLEVRRPDREYIEREQNAAGLSRFRKHEHRSADQFDDAGRVDDFARVWHPVRCDGNQRAGRAEMQDEPAREEGGENNAKDGAVGQGSPL